MQTRRERCRKVAGFPRELFSPFATTSILRYSRVSGPAGRAPRVLTEPLVRMKEVSCCLLPGGVLLPVRGASGLWAAVLQRLLTSFNVCCRFVLFLSRGVVTRGHVDCMALSPNRFNSNGSIRISSFSINYREYTRRWFSNRCCLIGYCNPCNNGINSAERNYAI